MTRSIDSFGDQVKDARIARHWSAARLAEEKGAPHANTLYRLESGDSHVTTETLHRLARVLEMRFVVRGSDAGDIEPVPGGVQQWGLAIRMWRHSVGVSQQELAERAGYSQYTISTVERGVADPLAATLQDIADVCGLAFAVG